MAPLVLTTMQTNGMPANHRKLFDMQKKLLQTHLATLYSMASMWPDWENFQHLGYILKAPANIFGKYDLL